MLIETNNFRVIYIRKVCCFVRTDMNYVNSLQSLTTIFSPLP